MHSIGHHFEIFIAGELELIKYILLSFAAITLMHSHKRKIQTNERAYLLVTMGVAILTLLAYFPKQTIIIGILALLLALYYNYEKNKNRKNITQKEFYRIFRYISGSVNLGISPTSALSGSFAAVEDLQIRESMKKLGESYLKTGDINLMHRQLGATLNDEELGNFIFVVSSMQSIGYDPQLMRYQEEIYLSAYFNNLEQRIHSYKMKILAAGALCGLILMVNILIPMLTSLKEMNF